MSLPPEPKSSPLVQTLRWSFRPLPFMQECREKYGDNFSVKFLTFERPMVMISDPAAIKALYMERSHGLPPGRDIILTPIVGARSLLVTEGADHLAHRKLMLPPFHGERMRSYQPLVEEIVDREIDSWPLGEEFPIHPRMQAITLEVILRVVFGVADGPRLERLRVVLTKVLEETASPFAQLIGLASRRFGGRGPWAKFERQLKLADELLYAEIAEHRARGDYEERDDILSLLMQARFEDGCGMSDTDLRDQLMTLLLAGHETTATALAWTFDLLLRHPGPMQRLRESLEAGEDDYLRAVISESLRLRPVVPLAGRRLNADLVVRRADPARRHRRDPGDLAHPHPRRRLPRALRLPPRALPRGRARHLRLDPLRRRHPPLHRRRLRRVRDADRPARGADPLRAAQGQPGAGEDRPPQHHPLAARRHPGRRHRPPPGARARPGRRLVRANTLSTLDRAPTIMGWPAIAMRIG